MDSVERYCGCKTEFGYSEQREYLSEWWKLSGSSLVDTFQNDVEIHTGESPTYSYIQLEQSMFRRGEE
jgi:hypothetical protein